MKRILQAIGAALLASAPQGALALDAEMALDRFPSGGAPAVGDVRIERDHALHRRESMQARDWHAPARAWQGSGRYRSAGSFIEARDLGGAVERGAFYGTSGTANSPSLIVINAPGAFGSIGSGSAGTARGGAKILDVEADRLDRRPYGRDGLDVAYVGTAKIIRIAPDFRTGGHDEREETAPASTPFADLSPREQAVAVYPDTDMADRPVDPPAPRVAETAPPAPAPSPAPEPSPQAAAFLEPWTPEWLRDCVARHPDFDASLGTFTAEDGRRRFCTGEP